MTTAQYYTQDEIIKFTQKICSLIAEITEMKKITDPSKFKAEYDDISDKLTDVLDLCQFNIVLANERFQTLPISKFENFNSYVYNTDVTVINVKKGNNERVKMLRAKRKESNCPECSSPLIITDGTISCTKCNYSSDLKNTHNKTSSDASKHIYKQLDAITGIKKPPSNIIKITSFISTWLTDLSFIYNWLVRSNKLHSWMKKFDSVSNNNINLTFFQQKIERTPENTWSYEIYKLFTDELFNLLESVKRYSKLKSSNIEALNKDEIMNIFVSYIKDNGTKIPNPNVIYKYKGVEYEIGLYVNSLSLIYNPPAGSIKYDLEKLFNKSLTLPGLMFNFNEIYERSENVPKRYNLTQEYIYIIHETFNISYVDIPRQDKDAIVMLISKFNVYYKNETFKRTGKECNAPLFCCSLNCIINQLMYFTVYKDALKLLPNKDKGTMSHIKSEWFRFCFQNQELLSKYTTNNVIVNNETSTNELIIEEEDSPSGDESDKNNDEATINDYDSDGIEF